MSLQTVIKASVAVGITGLVVYVTFRGNGFWWRLSLRSRLIFAGLGVAVITAAGVFFQTR